MSTAPDSRVLDCVRTNYKALVRFDKDFRAAQSLLGYVTTLNFNAESELDLRMGWGVIAQNHAALSVFHFGKSLLAIRTYAGRVPASDGPIDTTQLRLAWKLYQREFPHVENVRHAIAHAGELNSTPERMAAHSESRGSTFGYVVDRGKVIGSARLRIGMKGQWFELDIGEQTAQTLAHIIGEVGRALPSPLTVGVLR